MLKKGERQSQSEPEKQSNVEVGTVYQLTVGRHHYGFWTTPEEAKEYVRQKINGKVHELTGIQPDPSHVAEGFFYIQPRALYSFDKSKENFLK